MPVSICEKLKLDVTYTLKVLLQVDLRSSKGSYRLRLRGFEITSQFLLFLRNVHAFATPSIDWLQNNGIAKILSHGCSVFSILCSLQRSGNYCEPCLLHQPSSV